MSETSSENDVGLEEAENLKIGARLRAVRKGSGITLEQLAQATNLSRAFLSRVENDTALPRLPTLLAICKALALPVGSLFTAAEESLVRAGEGLPIVPVAGGEVMEWLVTPSSEPNVQLLRASYPPGGGSGEDLHELDAEVEVVHVQRGRLAIRFATGDVELNTGDTLTFRAKEPHGWWNPDTEVTADVLWVIAPAPWGLRRRAAAAEASQTELASIQGA